MNLLFKISYGLYVLSASADGKDNGCMINTFQQQTSNPERFSITVNKLNLTHDLIAKSKKCSVTVLSDKTAFDTIKNFGMQSGNTADKFKNVKFIKSENGTLIPTDGALGYFQLDVENAIDMVSHTMFILSAAKNTVLEEGEALTYGFYQSNIKPKPQLSPATDAQESWVCKVCGYVHKGPLPKDFICPICKHGVSDFEKVSN